MRCKACDSALSDREATRKSVRTGEYLDLCDTCLDTIKEYVIFTENDELSPEIEEDNDK